MNLLYVGKASLSHDLDIGKGWSCPDFVKLDFKERAVSVVEVSVAWDVTRLAKKISRRRNTMA
jgi:hypothetical protein